MNKIEINTNRRAYRWKSAKTEDEEIVVKSLGVSRGTLKMLEEVGIVAYRGGGKHGTFAEKSMKACLVLLGHNEDTEDLIAIIRRDRDLAKSTLELADNLEELAKQIRNLQ